jgi:hypothetical protein
LECCALTGADKDSEGGQQEAGEQPRACSPHAGAEAFPSQVFLCQDATGGVFLHLHADVSGFDEGLSFFAGHSREIVHVFFALAAKAAAVIAHHGVPRFGTRGCDSDLLEGHGFHDTSPS